MTAKNLSTITTDLITSYGKTARNMIHVYRMGNQRVARYVDQRWEKALAQSASELRNEVRKNAMAVQKTVNGLYVKGITISSDGAEGVVGKFVELAGRGVQQVAANASQFEQRTGIKTLNSLAEVAKPAVRAVSVLAEKIETGSSALASKVAGPSRGMPWIREGKGMTAADIVASCEGSLRRLQTDVIDLYQIHWPERHVPAFGIQYYDPAKETAQTPIHEQLQALAGLLAAVSGAWFKYSLVTRAAYNQGYALARLMTRLNWLVTYRHKKDAAWLTRTFQMVNQLSREVYGDEAPTFSDEEIAAWLAGHGTRSNADLLSDLIARLTLPAPPGSAPSAPPLPGRPPAASPPPEPDSSPPAPVPPLPGRPPAAPQEPDTPLLPGEPHGS